MRHPQVREYIATSTSTNTFGRVMCNVRDHVFVVDGPTQNGCPGVAITPAELFLTGVGSCAVELIQVIAREQDMPLRAVKADVQGTLGGSTQDHREVTLFDSVQLEIELEGVTEKQGIKLVEQFKSR